MASQYTRKIEDIWEREAEKSQLKNVISQTASFSYQPGTGRRIQVHGICHLCCPLLSQYCRSVRRLACSRSHSTPFYNSRDTLFISFTNTHAGIKNDLPTALQQARLNAEIGESRKSLHVLSRYIRHVPSDMFVAKFLVLMLRTVGRVKDSAIVLARAIAANIREGYRPDPESFVELGTIYYEGELYQESVMCVDLLKAVLDIRKFKDPPPRFPYPSAPQESLDNNDEEGASLSEESPSLREEEVRSILLFISQQIVESEASADEEELARFFRSGERGEQHPHQEKVLSFSSSGPLFSTNRVATGELQQQHKEKMRLSLKMICEELLRAPSVKDDLSSLCHLLFTPTSSNSKSSIPFLVNESTFNRESLLFAKLNLTHNNPKMNLTHKNPKLNRTHKNRINKIHLTPNVLLTTLGGIYCPHLPFS